MKICTRPDSEQGTTLSQRFHSFIFREVHCEEELEALLRFRYQRFVEEHVGSVVSRNEDKLDLDAFDARARHFALFAITRASNVELAGYARIVTSEEGPAADWVRSIARRNPAAGRGLEREHSGSFPSLDHFGEAAPHFQALMDMGESICEASHLVIRKDIRSLRLCRFMTHALVAYWHSQPLDHAVISCWSSHAAFYAHMGFEDIPGTEPRTVENLPSGQNSCMILGKEGLNGSHRFLREMGERLSEDGSLTFELQRREITNIQERRIPLERAS